MFDKKKKKFLSKFGPSVGSFSVFFNDIFIR